MEANLSEKLYNKLSLVATEAHIAVSIFNENLELIWFNKQFEKSYGYTLGLYIKL